MRKTVVWLVTGILSVIISGWLLIASIGMYLLILFLSTGPSIDGQRATFTKDEKEFIVIIFGVAIVSAGLAIFSFYRYHKANVFNRTQALTSNRKV
ncbi:MAG TPA: hypothetical protein VF941_03730 [Clostridia bacterium]